MPDKKKETELDKARGQTADQQALRKYHDGDFQTTDPVTGEPRGKMGGNWQDPDSIEDNVIGEELSPDDLKAAQKEEVARSAGAAPKKAKAAKKSGRKGR